MLAMFVSNVTLAIIVAGTAGFGFGFGPIGVRLPVVQGTSFTFIPVMIPAVAGAGVAGLFGLMSGVRWN